MRSDGVALIGAGCCLAALFLVDEPWPWTVTIVAVALLAIAAVHVLAAARPPRRR